MLDKIKKDFTTMTWVLIPVAIAINIVVGQIVVFLKLPVFLDSIGTVLVGMAYFDEPTTTIRLLLILAIVAAIAALKLTG